MIGNIYDVPLISYSTGSETDIFEVVSDFINMSSAITTHVSSVVI